MVESTGSYDEGEGRVTEGGVGVDARLLCSRVGDKEIVVEVRFDRSYVLIGLCGSPGKCEFGVWMRVDNRSGR